jgi:hypothetical protein
VDFGYFFFIFITSPIWIIVAIPWIIILFFYYLIRYPFINLLKGSDIYTIIGNLYGSVVQPFEDVNLHLFDKLKNFYYQNTFIALLLSFILLFIYIVLIKENNNK